MDIKVVFNTNDLDIMQFTSFDEGNLKYRLQAFHAKFKLAATGNKTTPCPHISRLNKTNYLTKYNISGSILYSKKYYCWWLCTIFTLANFKDGGRNRQWSYIYNTARGAVLNALKYSIEESECVVSLCIPPSIIMTVSSP